MDNMHSFLKYHEIEPLRFTLDSKKTTDYTAKISSKFGHSLLNSMTAGATSTFTYLNCWKYMFRYHKMIWLLIYKIFLSINFIMSRTPNLVTKKKWLGLVCKIIQYIKTNKFGS